VAPAFPTLVTIVSPPSPFGLGGRKGGNTTDGGCTYTDSSLGLDGHKQVSSLAPTQPNGIINVSHQPTITNFPPSLHLSLRSNLPSMPQSTPPIIPLWHDGRERWNLSCMAGGKRQMGGGGNLAAHKIPSEPCRQMEGGRGLVSGCWCVYMCVCTCVCGGGSLLRCTSHTPQQALSSSKKGPFHPSIHLAAHTTSRASNSR
jgi:hypothetical protein